MRVSDSRHPRQSYAAQFRCSAVYLPHQNGSVMDDLRALGALGKKYAASTYRLTPLQGWLLVGPLSGAASRAMSPATSMLLATATPAAHAVVSAWTA